MSTAIKGYSEVSRAFDDLTSSPAVPRGLRGIIPDAIDRLKEGSDPAEIVNIAERISLTVLQHEWALLKGDDEKADSARRQLTGLGETWRLSTDLCC